MRKLVLASMVLLALSLLVFAPPDERRYVLQNPADVPDGCSVQKQLLKVTVITCPEGIATALGLSEDLVATTMDTIANAQINADDVHTLGFDGTGRTVAVLDTGTNCGHPELSDSCVSGWDFVNNDPDASDDNGHGTFVTGIVTANGITPRAKGVAPGATVKAYKVLAASGSGFFSDIIEAIYNASDSPEVDAISMSLGTSSPYLWRSSNCDSTLPELTTAINYALSKGKVVVAAAGNSGRAGVSLPGCISKVIAAGAVDSADRIASFSGRGFPMKDHGVVAPGVSIYSTTMSGGYGTGSGTSFSTPMVSALVALVRHKNSSTTPDLIKAKIFSTAIDLGKSGADNDYGKGRIDALACVQAV